MSRSEHLSITRPGKSTGLEVRIWQIILQLWTMAFWRASTTWLAVTPITPLAKRRKKQVPTIGTPGPTRRRVMPDYGTGNFQREVRHGFRQGQFGRAAFQMNPLLTEAADGQTYVSSARHLFSDAATWMALVALTGHCFPKELRIELIDASGFLGIIRGSFHDVL